MGAGLYRQSVPLYAGAWHSMARASYTTRACKAESKMSYSDFCDYQFHLQK